MTAPDPAPRPYRDGAHRYSQAGWLGVIPLPVRRKGPPPEGWTGRHGAWPSAADVAAWQEGPEAAGNVALRLPPTVVGIDVDAYGDKQGAATFRAAQERWGPLPPTWRDTSRDDGVSGIYLFRVPAGLAWPGELGPGIEVIQTNHRYALVWPSIHPDTGGTYRWITPAGVVVVSGMVPAVEELPELPDAWVGGLTGGRLDDDVPKAELSDVEASAWLVMHGGGAQCPAIRETVDRYLSTRFDGTASRHDAARDATARLFSMAADGHTGSVSGVNEIGLAFRAAFDGRGRDFDRGEWHRLYLGAVRMAAVRTPEAPPGDPCLLPPLPEVEPYPEPAQAPAPAATATETVDPAPAGPSATPALPATAEQPVGVIDVGDLSPADAAALAWSRQVDAEVRIQRARREARRLLEAQEAAEAFRQPPTRWTLTEELELPDPDVTWAVESVLPTAGNALLTAQFKAGKTTLVTHLARCLADAEPFLGRFAIPEPCSPDARVALWNYEVGEGQYRRWLRDAGIVHTDHVAPLNLRGFSLPVGAPVVQDWIVQWLKARRVRVWIVDPFARAFAGTNENDNSEVGRFLETLDVIKERAGVSELILPTHTGRAEQEVGKERARGATRLDDWPDVRWALNKDPLDNRYFAATGRDTDVPEFQIGFNSTTRQLYATGQGSRQEVAVSDTDARLAAIIQATPGASTTAVARAFYAVREGTPSGSQQTNVAAMLAALEARGLARREVGPRNANTWYSTGPRVIPEEG